jgi:hypothetical protein
MKESAPVIFNFSPYASTEIGCPKARVSEIEFHFLPGTAYKLTATLQLPFLDGALWRLQ